MPKLETDKLKRKLLRVERTINTYTLGNESIDEINIDNIPFETLKRIVTPKEDDPLLYDGYVLNANQLNELNVYIAEKIKVDMKSLFYVLECSGIYE